MRTDAGVGGKAVAAYQTNGRRPYGALRLDAVPESLPQLSVRIEGNAAKGSTLRSPNYLLGNTASETWNLRSSSG